MAVLKSSLVVGLIDRVTAPARKVSRGLLGIKEAAGKAGKVDMGSRLEAGINRNNAALDRSRGRLVDAAAGFYALKAAITAPLQAASAFESAMADVRKVVDFPTPKAFKDFRSDILNLSEAVPVTVDGLAQIAAAAGEAGIQGAELVKFTDAAAKIGVAFGMSADMTGESLAKMMTGLDLTVDQVVLLSDSMNHLSNNMASNGSQLVDFVKRVGATAKTYGFTAREAAAFGSAMIAAGADTNVAATSFRNMGRALTKGESATERQSKAMRRLGLDAVEVAKSMQEDAVGTTMDALRRISELPEELRASVSSDLFGDEARALGPLLPNLGLIEKSLGLVSKESEFAGSAFQEFGVRSATFDAQMQTFRNRITRLGIAIGDALMPAILQLTEAMVPLLKVVTDFAQANPDLTTNVLGATAAIIGFKVALTSLRFVGLLGRGGALSLLAIGFNTVGRAAISARSAITGTIGVQTALARATGRTVGKVDKLRLAVVGLSRLTGLSVVAGGLTAVVGAVAAISAPVWIGIAAAIGAVAGAGALIYRNWDQISSVVRGVAAGVADVLAPAFEQLKPLLDAVRPTIDGIGRGISGLGSAISSFISKIGDLFSLGSITQNLLTDAEKADVENRARNMTKAIIRQFFLLPVKMAKAGVDAMAGLLRGLKQGMAAILSWAGQQASSIASAINPLNYLPGRSGGAVSTPSPSAGSQGRRPPRRALGGRVLSGKTFQHSEKGAELLTPNRMGFVNKNRDFVDALVNRAEAVQSFMRAEPRSSATADAGSREAVFHNTFQIGSGSDAVSIAKRVAAELETQMRVALDGSHIEAAT